MIQSETGGLFYICNNSWCSNRTKFLNNDAQPTLKSNVFI